MFRRPPRAVTIASALALVVSTAVLALASPALAAPGCSVAYTKQWDNGSGFGANLAITNTGDPITGWSLVFDFPGNQPAGPSRSTSRRAAPP
jgi:cellulose 1,4-beta-cellobiosidase